MISNAIILSKTGIDLSNISQGSEEWMSLRLGVITASEVWKVLKTTLRDGMERHKKDVFQYAYR